MPLPLPLAPAVIDSQLSVSAAVHVQPLGAVTVTLPVPPPATMLADSGETVNEHATPF